MKIYKVCKEWEGRRIAGEEARNGEELDVFKDLEKEGEKSHSGYNLSEEYETMFEEKLGAKCILQLH